MKVCTDACLFGGWLAKEAPVLNSTTLLDIGTGTGLLSLMLAQSTEKNTTPTNLTAIEIESAAAKQAKENIFASPWGDRIEVIHDSIQNFAQSSISNERKKYDCIICNPPFYEGDLKSPDQKVNLASHSTALPWEILLQNVTQLLHPAGYYYVLIPSLRAYTMQKIAAVNGLHLKEEITIYNKQGQLPFRTFQKFKWIEKDSEQPPIRSSIFIKDNTEHYTPAFIALLKDYYLHL